MSRVIRDFGRRGVLKGGGALLAATALGVGGHGRRAGANNHPHPHEGSLDYLDPRTYVSKVEVHHHFEGGPPLGGK